MRQSIYSQQQANICWFHSLFFISKIDFYTVYWCEVKVNEWKNSQQTTVTIVCKYTYEYVYFQIKTLFVWLSFMKE